MTGLAETESGGDARSALCCCAVRGWIRPVRGMAGRAVCVTGHTRVTCREAAHLGNAAFEIYSVAIGADVRIFEECIPVVLVPVFNMLAGFGIESGVIIRAAAAGERHERTRYQHCNDPCLCYLWHVLHLSLF